MKRGWIITLIIILLLLIGAYFFNPACNFHKVGSTFKVQNMECECGIIKMACEGNYIEISNEDLSKKVNEAFANN